MLNEQYTMEDLITRFLDGSTTEEENKELFRWLADSKENEKTFDDIQLIWELGQLAGKKSHAETIFHNLECRIQDNSKTSLSPRRFRLLYPLIGIAAIFLLIFVIRFITKEDSQNVRIVMQLATPSNTKDKIQLTDQSVIWLNQQSILEYPETFHDSIREVKITGEACFDITQDKNRPFIVDLGIEKIKVIGTTFNVKNTDKISEVVLISGSIEFTADNKTYKLNPNEKLTYNKENNYLIIEPVDASIYTIWINDRLRFDNERLTYVVACLEKWFDVEINSLTPIDTITGVSFSVKNETIEEVLKGLQTITSTKLQISNK